MSDRSEVMTDMRTTLPGRKGYRLIERGDRPCERCGKAHDLWHENGSRFYGSWASLDDGHVYERASWEELGRRWIALNPVERP